jgi:hypothetical protein
MIRNPKAIIYSDSDGVIADFMAGAAKVLGHVWDSHHLDHLRKAEQGLILNKHEEFWETLPPMPDWKVYWDYIKKYDPHILTAVPSWDHNFAEVEAGKREWYRRHIPSLPASHIHVVYRADKAKYAKHGDVRNILIDDHPKNVKEFEAAGGIGIYHVSAKVTIIKLKELGYH